MTAVDLRLCAILDPERLAGDPGEVALAAARGGCTLIEFTAAGADARALVAAARRIKAALEGTGVPLVVGSRVDVAVAAEADGVHVRQRDLHPSDARHLLGRERVIAITVDSPAQADELYRMPIDCCWVASVFAPEPDSSLEAPQGLNGLSRVAFRARLASGGAPVGASGGIEAANAGRAIGAGADGVAAALPTPTANEAFEAARALRRAVDDALGARAAARP